MTAPLQVKAPIVTAQGLPTRELVAYLQSLGTGIVKRSTYTAAQLAAITPAAGSVSFCTDSSVTTFANVLAGGGANGVPVYGDGTNWRVG